VVIPTASAIPEERARVYTEVFQAFNPASLEILMVDQRSDASDKDALKIVEDCTAVMFAGETSSASPPSSRHAPPPGAIGKIQGRVCGRRHLCRGGRHVRDHDLPEQPLPLHRKGGWKSPRGSASSRMSSSTPTSFSAAASRGWSTPWPPIPGSWGSGLKRTPPRYRERTARGLPRLGDRDPHRWSRSYFQRYR